MKKVFYYLFALLAMVQIALSSVTLTSCSKDDDDDNNSKKQKEEQQDTTPQKDTTVAEIVVEETSSYLDFSITSGDEVMVNGLKSTYSGVTIDKTTFSSIEIPDKVKIGDNTYKVTAIKASAFEDCTGLTKGTVSGTVKTIGKDAFRNCSNLDLVVADTAVSVGTDAFRNIGSVTYLNAGEPLTTVSGNIGGYDYVDLGLSVKWATFDVGASKIGEKGNSYAWGEISPKSSYTWSNYKYANGDYTKLTKYNSNSYNGKVDNMSVLESTDDAAKMNWGLQWRMPTKDEISELVHACNWFGTDNYKDSGYDGWVGTAANGNEIFLPYNQSFWSADLRSANIAYYLSSSHLVDLGSDSREQGFMVRAVSDK